MYKKQAKVRRGLKRKKLKLKTQKREHSLENGQSFFAIRF